MTAKRERAAALVQYMVLTGVVALGAVGGFTAFSGKISAKSGQQGQCVKALDGWGCGASAQAASNGIVAPRAGASPVALACAGGQCASPGNCFAAGTLVATPEGPRSIESLAVGDFVASRDESAVPGAHESDARGDRRVVHTFRTENRPVMRVVVRRASDNTVEALTVTPEHRVYEAERGFMNAEDLHAGASHLVAESGALEVLSTQMLAEPVTVYNVEVEDFHTYYAGALGAWVHNQCMPNGGIDRSPPTAENRRRWEAWRRQIDAQANAPAPLLPDNSIYGPPSVAPAAPGISYPSISADNRTPEEHIASIYNSARMRAGIRPVPGMVANQIIGQAIQRGLGAPGTSAGLIRDLVTGAINPIENDRVMAIYLEELNRNREALDFYYRQARDRAAAHPPPTPQGPPPLTLGP